VSSGAYPEGVEVLAALIPSAGVGFLFYLAIRAIMSADRKERAAIAKLDAADRGDSRQESASSTSSEGPTASA
jgi:hypothetical protein